MSQWNKLSDFQYARFQILIVPLYHVHFGLFLISWYPHFVEAIQNCQHFQLQTKQLKLSYYWLLILSPSYL